MTSIALGVVILQALRRLTIIILKLHLITFDRRRMADQKPPVAPSIVTHALRPQVAIYTSPDVDDLARSNGLANLAQLLKPWEGSVERGVRFREALNS